jgi:hypothetical protein
MEDEEREEGLKSFDKEIDWTPGGPGGPPLQYVRQRPLSQRLA